MPLPAWVKRAWVTTVAGIVGTSAVWTFFFVRMTELKDEQVKVMQSRAAAAVLAEGLPRRLDQLEARVAFFQRMLQVDPVDGRWRLGGISGPSDLTTMVTDAEAKAKSRDFDGALDVARHAEEIFPDFAGAAYIRFLVESEKGYEQAAVEDARKAVTLAPTDRRLLPLHFYLVDHFLRRNEKKQAEEFARRALQLAPDDKQLAERFTSTFGFVPTGPH